MINPAWQAAEVIRLEAEAKYAQYMKNRLEDSDADRAKILELNAEIETANQGVRRVPQNIDE